MSVAVTKLWDKFTATPEEKLKRLGDQIKRIDDLINKRIKDLNSYNTAQSVIEKYNELDTNTRLRRRPEMQNYLDAVNKEFNRSFQFIDNNLIVDLSENDYKDVHNQNQLKDLQAKNRKLKKSLDVQIEDLDYTFDKSEILSFTKFQTKILKGDQTWSELSKLAEMGTSQSRLKDLR